MRPLPKYRKDKTAMEQVARARDIKVFLDSGAFSAFSQGAEIKIDDYITFIKEHKPYLEVYANLDVIGDPEGTLKNQKIMEKAGLDPLPCFHYGEDPKYLQYYIEHYDYVALGGMVPISTPDLILWLDEIFSKYICDEKGMPRVKIHGFGLTSHRLLVRYPWWSVDSTSWVMTGRLGSVYVPRFRAGKYDYLQDAWKVAVSTRSPSQKEAGKHISSFSPGLRAKISEYFTHKGYQVGKSRFRTEKEGYKLKENERWNGKALDGKREVEEILEPGLSNDYKQRDELNIIYFLDLEKALPEWPWAFKEAGGGRQGFGL
jgi:hypothetical protein